MQLICSRHAVLVTVALVLVLAALSGASIAADDPVSMISLTAFTQLNFTTPRPNAVFDAAAGRALVVFEAPRGAIALSSCLAPPLDASDCTIVIPTINVTAQSIGLNANISLRFRSPQVAVADAPDAVLVLARVDNRNNTLVLFSCARTDLTLCTMHFLGSSADRDSGFYPDMVVNPSGPSLLVVASAVSRDALAGWVCSLSAGDYGQCSVADLTALAGLSGVSDAENRPSMLLDAPRARVLIVTTPLVGGLYVYSCALDFSACNAMLLQSQDLYFGAAQLFVNPLTGELGLTAWRAGNPLALAVYNCGAPVNALPVCTFVSPVTPVNPSPSSSVVVMFDTAREWLMLFTVQTGAAVLDRCQLSNYLLCEQYVLVGSDVFGATSLFSEPNLMTFGATFPSFDMSLASASVACPVSAVASVASPSEPVEVEQPTFVFVDARNADGFSVSCSAISYAVRRLVDNATLASFFNESTSTLVLPNVGTVAGSVAVVVSLDGAPMSPNPLNIPVLPGVAYAPNTRVTGDALSGFETYARVYLTVSLYDRFGNARVAGNDSLDQVDATLSSSSFDVLVSVSFASPGVFTLSFTAVQPGVYSLSVFVAGMAIGPPFLIPVTAVCPPGLFAPIGTDACEPCPLNTYTAERGSTACTACPSGTATATVGAVSVASCACVPGLYTTSGEGSECLICPLHATCAGGVSLPRANPGFAPVTPDRIVACPYTPACIGGGECALGYTGQLCEVCLSDLDRYYQDALGACTKCTQLGSVWPIAPLVLAGLAFAGVSGFAARVARFSLTRATYTFVEFPHALTLAVSGFQLIALVGASALSWPISTQRALTGLFFFSGLDWLWLGTGCQLHSFSARYVASMITPLVLLAMAIVAAQLLRLAGVLRVSKPLLAVSFVLLGAPLAYVPLARATLVLFACRRLPTDVTVLAVDLGERCFSSQWYALLPLGLAGIVLYIIGLPALTLLVLARFAPAELFRQRRRWVALVPFARGLAVVLASLLLIEWPAIQGATLLSVILLSAGMYALFEPHFVPLYDRLEVALAALLAMLVACGLTFVALPTGGSLRTAVMVVTLILLGLLLGGGLVAVAHELVATARGPRKRIVAQDASAIGVFNANAPDMPAMSSAIERVARLFRETGDDANSSAAIYGTNRSDEENPSAGARRSFIARSVVSDAAPHRTLPTRLDVPEPDLDAMMARAPATDSPRVFVSQANAFQQMLSPQTSMGGSSEQPTTQSSSATGASSASSPPAMPATSMLIAVQTSSPYASPHVTDD